MFIPVLCVAIGLEDYISPVYCHGLLRMGNLDCEAWKQTGRAFFFFKAARPTNFSIKN